MSSAIAVALAELLDRLTIEEKREFARLIDWQEFQWLRMTAAESARCVGDPKVYVGTTPDGLSLELPVGKVPAFLSSLPGLLAANAVAIFVQDGDGSQEWQCPADELASWLAVHSAAWRDGSLMIEFGPYTLVSGGGGCLSLILIGQSGSLRRAIAEQALTLCGFRHTFTGERFSAIVWEDRLEVSE
jgi:hypothetical protein